MMEPQSLKTNRTIRRAMAAAAAASALLMAGGAQAALQDRDLNGDTVVDAFYDTDLDVTRLRNADVNGLMSQPAAGNWAADFSFGGYDDWWLPTSDTCWGYNCTASGMGHLWCVELGNLAGGPMTNTGSFENLQSYVYWSGAAAATPSDAWNFYTLDGFQYADYNQGALYAMAVRPGDVAVVPEPGSCALMLAGLTALALARRRRFR